MPVPQGEVEEGNTSRSSQCYPLTSARIASTPLLLRYLVLLWAISATVNDIIQLGKLFSNLVHKQYISPL